MAWFCFFLGLLPLLVLGLPKKYLYKALFIFLLLLVSSFSILYVRNEGVVYIKDGVYERITIYDGVYDERPTRFFLQDRSSSGAMFLDSDDPGDLPLDYANYYALYKIFTPDVKNALIIGGGAYSLPKVLLTELPNAIVDVSEIEPSLLSLSKKYFRVTDSPRLQDYTIDGRRLLTETQTKYDLIFSDVYYSLYSIPTHFTTVEFFRIAKDGLNDEGIFLANIIGDLSVEEPSFVMSEIKTFKSVFPNSYFFAVDSPDKIEPQNIIFVGYNSERIVNVNSPEIVGHTDKRISSLGSKIIDTNQFDLSPYPILTDNFAPVEFLVGQLLRKNN